MEHDYASRGCSQIVNFVGLPRSTGSDTTSRVDLFGGGLRSVRARAASRVDEEIQVGLLARLDRFDALRTKAVAAIDAAISASDTIRRGIAQSAHQLMDARLTEAAWRHRRVCEVVRVVWTANLPSMFSFRPRMCM